MQCLWLQYIKLSTTDSISKLQPFLNIYYSYYSKCLWINGYLNFFRRHNWFQTPLLQLGHIKQSRYPNNYDWVLHVIRIIIVLITVNIFLAKFIKNICSILHFSITWSRMPFKLIHNYYCIVYLPQLFVEHSVKNAYFWNLWAFLGIIQQYKCTPATI